MKILMVCLGNICRSPLAEGILRKKAEETGLEIQVDSAGTSNYHSGENPDRRSVANAIKNGVDISSLVSRQFKVSDFDTFDRIFVMDSNNYADVIIQARSNKDKEKVELILNKVFPNSNKPVPDPYFGGENGFEEVFQLLEKACQRIIEEISMEIKNVNSRQ